MADLEVKALHEDSPAHHYGRLRGLNPLQVAMVRFDEELLATEVPCEGIDCVEDGICLALVGVPLGGRLGEALGCKGDWLVDYLPVYDGVLEQDRTHSEFSSVRAQCPG